ncbi:ABC transporter ATP-binding protein [Methanomassiliicoccales archaeon LGM-RCC1]|nr:ABC transporter ATP-binding protein [Methanomassiliicoccales archaeon LGM-RCC1]
MRRPEDWTLVRLLKPFVPAVIIIAVIQVIGVFSQVMAITLLKPMLNQGVYDQDMGSILHYGIILIVLTIISAIVLITTSYMASKVSMAVSEFLRKNIMEAAVRTENLEALGSTTNTMTCLINDVNFVHRYVFETLRTYLPMPFLMAVLFWYTYNINPQIALILISTLVVVILLTYLATARINKLYSTQMEKMDRVNLLLREKMTGARTIRTYNAYDYENKKFSEASTEFGAMNWKVTLNSYFIPNISTAFMWAFITFMFLAAALDSSETIVPEDIIVFMQYATYIVSTLVIIPYLCIESPRSRTCFDRINNIIRSAVEEAKEPASPVITEKQLVVRDLNLIDNLGRKSLDNVNMEIRRGSTVTILGTTTSGVYFLSRIIWGFGKPDSGSVTIDGMDKTKVDPAVLRERMAFSGNNMNIFRGTLRYNLDPRGRKTDEEIMDVCDRVGLTRMMSGDLDTVIDDETMSGGQRLLVIMARGLLKDADINVFDDCFFSLDPETKNLALNAVREICRGRTVIFVMHDTSTCEISDDIILMNNGRVEAEGSHQALMDTSELYRSMYVHAKGGQGTWA